MPTFLPELVSNILLFLPVKSLLRFRCLSTSLCAEISSADFVKNHINRSIEGKTHLKILIEETDLSLRVPANFYAADFDDTLREAILLHNPLKRLQFGTRVCGSCNGLILFGLSTLWNPFTRRYKNIPGCPVRNLRGFKGNHCYGLGYDSALDDYKIVLISEISDSERDHVSFQVWVFSLKSNSWQKNQDAPLVRDDRILFEGIFANGALHWECDGYILGFDLVNEVFFRLTGNSGPGKIVINHLGVFSYERTMMLVLGGNLYTARITAEGRTVEFYIFVSDNGEQGAGCSWKKAFALEAEEISGNDEVCFPWPLACSKGGDSILLYKSDGLFWYNPENEVIQRVEIAGMPQVQGNIYGYYACCESLVSLGDDSAFDGAAQEEMQIVWPKGRKC